MKVPGKVFNAWIFASTGHHGAPPFFKDFNNASIDDILQKIRY